MQMDIRILLLFMMFYGWHGKLRKPNRDALAGFCPSPAETNGRGFRRKMASDQMCAGSLLSSLLFFYGLSYHTNNIYKYKPAP